MILYADGRLFLRQWGERRYALVMRQLERGEICAFLNTVDQFGFFDYDPATYGLTLDRVPPVEGGGAYWIAVDAWRSNEVSLYGLGTFVENDLSWYEPCDTCSPLPTILPALRDTYLLVSHYNLDGLQVYQPDKMMVWVRARRQYSQVEGEGELLWPLESPRLADLAEMTAEQDAWVGSPFVLEGEAAQVVYALFEQSIAPYGLVISEGEQVYEVYARPLLPYEVVPGPNEYHIRIPGVGDQGAGIRMSCSPEDGLIEVPEE